MKAIAQRHGIPYSDPKQPYFGTHSAEDLNHAHRMEAVADLLDVVCERSRKQLAK